MTDATTERTEPERETTTTTEPAYIRFRSSETGKEKVIKIICA